MKNKIFLLGVGAQKAGTSWLYEYLKSKHNTNLGLMKEYHIWDAAYIQDCKKKFSAKLQFPLPSVTTSIRWLMQKSDWFYFRYFKFLLDLPGVELSSDITPAYAGLNRKVFSIIKDNFNKIGVITKVVFLMRDPAERCLSAAAMSKNMGLLPANIDNNYFNKIFMSHAVEFRTRYEKTIAELESVFSPESIYYGIYEEMFEPENIIRISEFLGVGTDINFRNEIVNASPKLSLDEQIRSNIAVHYRETYEFAATRFPQIKNLWSGFKYI
jgi:hypothetical protein